MKAMSVRLAIMAVSIGAHMAPAASAADPHSRQQSLLAGARDPSAEVRRASIQALAEFKDPKISDALTDLANDPDPSVRRAVIHTLAAAPTPQCFDLFAKALTGDGNSSRTAAIEGLSKLKDPRCVEPLLGMLRSDEYNAQRARLVIVGFGDAAVSTVAKALDSREDLRRVLVQILTGIKTPGARAALAKAAAGGDPTLRLIVIQTLAAPDQAPQAERILLSALDDPAPDVRVAAMAGASRLAQAAGVRDALAKSVAAGLADRNPKMRAGALGFANYLPQPQGVELLAKMLQDADADIRRRVAIALSHSGNPAAIAPLLKAMDHADPAVSREAALGAGAFQQPQAVPFLKKAALKSAGGDGAANYALGRLGAKGLEALLDIVAANVPSSRGAARVLMDKHDPKVSAAAKGYIDRATTLESRRAFINIVASAKDPAAAAALGEVLKHPDQPTRQEAAMCLLRIDTAEGVGVLAKAFADLDLNTKVAVLKSLKDYSGFRDSQWLKLPELFAAAAEDKDAQVLAAAARVLIEKRIPGSSAIMCRLLERGILKASSPLGDFQKNMYLDALGRIEDVRAAPTLIAVLKDATLSSQFRRSAAYALGNTGGPGAGEALLACAAEKDDQLQEGCAWALGQLGVRGASTILQRLAADEKGFPFQRAAVALAAVDSRAAYRPFLSLLGQSGQDAELRKMMEAAEGGDVVDLLIAGLKGSPGTAFQSASWLGQIGDERAIKPMEDIVARSGDRNLREAVKNQLHWIRAKQARVARSSAPASQPAR